MEDAVIKKLVNETRKKDGDGQVERKDELNHAD